MTTDIFAPKELSQKLREIGFDEPCIAYYYLGEDNLVSITKQVEHLTDGFILGTFTQSNYAGIPAPTWEQVFKWFREKGIRGMIDSYYDVEQYKHYIYQDSTKLPILSDSFETYEQCREDLVLRLIELYKKQNNE